MKKASVRPADVLVGIFLAAVFIFLSFREYRVFESLERGSYSVNMRLDLPKVTAENRIAIVNIDEKSIRQLGPWPWPRAVIARMISLLKANGARIIALDLLFPEKEHNQGLSEIRKLHGSLLERLDYPRDSWLLQRLEEIEKRLDNDTSLSSVVRECGNVFLPVLGTFGGYDSELVLSEESFLNKGVLGIGAGMVDAIPVNRLTVPFPELGRSCRGLGHANLCPDALMEGQTHLLFINYRGHLIPSMPLRLALAYLDKQPNEGVVSKNGLKLRDAPIPIQKGELLIKFRGARGSFPNYSFADILKVKKVPAVFAQKIVLIGYTAQGGARIRTPVDLEMPRVEWWANIIENLLEGRYLLRPHYLVYVEAVVLIGLALFSCLVFPRFGFLNRLGLMVGLLVILFIFSFTAFRVFGIWFKTAYIALSVAAAFLVSTVREFIARERSLGVTSRESIETNRMLGLSFQSQGLLDLAFEKFRKCPLDDAMKDVIYNLGLDYERKRMINKAVAVYEYICQADGTYRGLDRRIPKLKKLMGHLALDAYGARRESTIHLSGDLDIRPTVGRYEVLSELGQGAMGVVYKARDPKINRLLAIKTIRFSDEFEDEKIEEIKTRFMREAEIAGKLSHPAIVSIFDVGEDYDLTYIAMEYLDGKSLSGYCSKDALLPFRQVLSIIAQAAGALDYSHRRGVIHRDIKPANIMLLKDGKVKVTDFGIAKAVSSSRTKSGIILGTPNYMSPEQINGQELDGRSDLFSLGVVFFELLTGHLPFQGKTLSNLFYRITQENHPSLRSFNPAIPKVCDQIMDKILAKDPQRRLQRAGELKKYLLALLQRIDRLRPRPKA
ncbi:MAG: CHASE2 domain-containing protein [Deltaproteobacteria bacterium]|nr:CHASE2 domain-containing protein [Deltaproteobacteria bacterium]